MQLRASHLILRLEPVYSTWQAFGQALLVDSHLLSYIDVRHTNFLPLRLTVREARDLGPRYTCSDELAPIRDESAERVSRRRRELAHQQVEQGNPPPVEPKAPTQEEEAVLCSAPRNLNSSSLPQLKLNLPLLLLLQVTMVKGFARLNNPNLARVMHRQKPLPGILKELRSENLLLSP